MPLTLCEASCIIFAISPEIWNTKMWMGPEAHCTLIHFFTLVLQLTRTSPVVLHHVQNVSFHTGDNIKKLLIKVAFFLSSMTVFLLDTMQCFVDCIQSSFLHGLPRDS